MVIRKEIKCVMVANSFAVPAINL